MGQRGGEQVPSSRPNCSLSERCDLSKVSPHLGGVAAHQLCKSPTVKLPRNLCENFIRQRSMRHENAAGSKLMMLKCGSSTHTHTLTYDEGWMDMSTWQKRTGTGAGTGAGLFPSGVQLMKRNGRKCFINVSPFERFAYVQRGLLTLPWTWQHLSAGNIFAIKEVPPHYHMQLSITQTYERFSIEYNKKCSNKRNLHMFIAHSIKYGNKNVNNIVRLE